MCNGVCVNLQSAATDCGRCGHSCLQGTCSAGTCQPWTVVASTDVHQMDADAKYVVWVDSFRDLHQIPIAGGAASTITPSTSPQPGAGPSLKGGLVGFLGQGISVYTAPEGQTAGMAIAPISNATTATFFRLNPSATTGFFIGQDNAAPNAVHLMQCPLAGGGCGPLGGVIESPGMAGYQTQGLVVSDDYAFWTYVNTASINSLTFATNAINTFKTAINSNLAIDANNIYYSGTPLYTIYSLPLNFTAASVPQKVANSAAHISSLATDGVNVYFGTSNLNGPATLSYAPVGGGTPTVMYTSPNAMGSDEASLVAAAGAIFWADGDLNSCPETFSIKGIAAP